MAIIKCGTEEMITIGEVPSIDNRAPNFWCVIVILKRLILNQNLKINH